MFPLADTLRLPVFPSLRFRRNRTTFSYVSVKFVVVFSFLCLLVYSVVVVAGLFGEHVYFLSPHS